MPQIIEQGSLLLDILISLLEMSESDCYVQLPFWRDLFRQVSRIEDEAQRNAKFAQFEQVVLKLVNLVIKRAKMEDTMFLDFNQIPSLSSDFEELYAVRRDLGSLLKGICKSCGALTIYPILIQQLSQAVARESQTTD